MKGFKKFLLRGNVVDLAIAVVIGAAFAAVVKAFADEMLTPLLGLFGGGGTQFKEYKFTINGQNFMYGVVIQSAMTFLITAAVVYFFVVLPVGKLMDRFKPEEDPETPKRDCTQCLSSIPAAATRCSFCTAEVSAMPAPAITEVK